MGAGPGSPRGFRSSQSGLVGLDLVEIERFRRALLRHPRLQDRLFTPAEIAYCTERGDPVLSLAARFAAKEAVGKLLGRGVVSWREIEVAGGATPRVDLSGRTASLASAQGIMGMRVSLSHVDSLAGACVVAVARAPEGDIMRRSTEGSEGCDCDCGCDSHGEGGAGATFLTSFHPLEERPKVFTPAQIRELDRAAIEDIGVPGPVLMERAALGVSALVLSRYPGFHTLIVCGRGNNGGDGLAAARQLHLAGQPVACIVAASSAEDLSPDAALNFKAAEKMGVNLRLAAAVPDYLWEETEVLVDCLLGTGAKGELEGQVRDWAQRVNQAADSGIPVVAVDIPTGVDGTTGSIAADTVAADITITFHGPKSGLVCPPGIEAAGEIVVWEIGLPAFLEPEPDLYIVSPEYVRIPGRRADDHKYRAGFVAIVAGSRAYPGAAWLASRGAARAGAGYVRLIMSSAAADGVRDRLVEVVLQEVGSGDYLEDPAAVLAAVADERIGALVIGPGLGRNPATLATVRKLVLETKMPAVLDADGLMAFAGDAEQLRRRPGLVLTPHVGELASLLGEPVADLAASSLLAARRGAELTGQVVLLKGSATVVAHPSGETRVVVQAPSQLASAGTGDVLSGVIGAFLSKGMTPLEAACAGAWVHAEAGLIGAETDPQGVLAGDLADLIPAVIADRLFERRPSWRS